MGCGRVGSTLARSLEDRNHTVSVIDSEPDAFRRLGPGFNGDKVTGQGFDQEVLEKAGIRRADAFAAVSSGDNSNIIAARVARETFGIQLVFSSAGAALATAVMSFPLMVRAIRLSLENIDPGLEEAARTLGAGPWDRFCTITLPLMLPGVLAGAVTAFAAGLGEFGAVITFVSNIPGETRTLPLALYTALQTPGGDALAARLAMVSFSLGLAGLLVAELLARRVRLMLGR